MTRIVSAWAEEWFANAPWQVLGTWDEVSDGGPERFNLLKRAKSMEIKGRPGTQIALAAAILGESDRTAETDQDAEIMRALGQRSIDDLAKRIEADIASERSGTASAFSTSFPRVFSILVGTVGQAHIAIECAMADLVAMARSTYPISQDRPKLHARDQARNLVDVSVAAKLGTAAISLKQLADLEAGDLLLLDTKPGGFAQLMVEDRPTELAVSIGEAENTLFLEFQGKK